MRTEDGYIVSKCINGESEAFGLLVDKYKGGIYAFVVAKLLNSGFFNFHDAQDVTQEIFIKAYEKLRSLRRWDSFLSWLYCIANTQCKIFIRRQAGRPDREFIEDQDSRTLKEFYTGPSREEPMLELLHEALDSLPETYRQVLMLYYLGGMSGEEIARFLRISPTSVWQRLSRARSKLKGDLLATMDTAFEGQRLQAGFTIRIVETVRWTRIHPVPETPGLPWGLSVAAGIILMVLGLSTHPDVPNPLHLLVDSSPPTQMKMAEDGDIPVDLLKILQMPTTLRGDDDILDAPLPTEQAALTGSDVPTVSDEQAMKGSEESPVILEYKLREGDQITRKVNINFSCYRCACEAQSEMLLTQVISEVSNNGSFELINISNTKLVNATKAGKDIRDQLWRGVKKFDVFQQKRRKDGSIIDYTGGLDILGGLCFCEPSFHGLPDNPVKVGSSWERTMQVGNGDVTMMYTLLGFEERKGYRCAKISGEAIGIPEIYTSAASTKLENTIYFAMEEGINVSQETILATLGASMSNFRVTMELQDRRHLPPEELKEIVEPARLLAVGVDHFEKKQYKAAGTEFQKFLSSYKESPWRSDVEKLLMESSQELTKKPAVSASTLRERLQACIDDGDLDRLLEMSAEAIADDFERRQSPVVWYMLVQGYEQHGKMDELLAHFQEKLNKDPENMDIYMIIGQIRERQANVDKAVEAYEKVLEVHPNDVYALISLASVHRRVGMHEEAIAIYRKAVEFGRVDLYSSIAECYATLGRSEEALKLIDELKKISQERDFAPGFLPYTIGDIYTAIGRYHEAIESYEQAARNGASPGDRLVSCYRAAGMNIEAVELQKAIQSPPGTPLPVQSEAPDFSLQSLGRQTVKLSDFRGRVVILNFWSTRVPDCMKEMAILEEFYGTHKDDAMVIGICVNSDGADSVRDSVEKLGISYPVLIASRGLLDEYSSAAACLFDKISTTFIIDRNGVIQREIHGSLQKTILEMAYGNASKLQKALQSPSGTPMPNQDEAPEFSLRSLGGQTVKLSDFRGRVVILNFWSTWVPDCMREIAMLEEFYRSHKDDAVVIGICVNNDGEDVVRDFVNKRGITYTILMAPRGMLAEYSSIAAYLVDRIPATFVIDRSGVIQSECRSSLRRSALEIAYENASDM